MDQKKIVVDTNIFLEFLLKQRRQDESVQLMRAIEEGKVEAYVTSFALHGIEVALERVKQVSGLEQFLDWVIHAQGLSVYQTSPDEEKQIAALTQKITLDFDDTLQYYVTQTLGAVLVSFDTDFDGTGIERVEPAEMVSRA